MRFKRKKGRKITKAKKHTVDGITFASGLELYCYRALIKAKIPHQYEGRSFELVEKFKFDGLLMDKGKTKGKTVYKEKTGNVRNISYTPDFINLDKGLRTAEFKMRFKLFLKYLHDTNQHLDVYVPSNQKEVDATIDLILNRGSFN